MLLPRHKACVSLVAASRSVKSSKKHHNGMLPNLVAALPAFLACQQALLMTQGEACKLHSLQADSKLLSAACEGILEKLYFREV